MCIRDRHMREHAAATGDILLREGHPAEEFFILIDGAVDLLSLIHI